MTDKIKLGAELTVDNKQIKSEFTKAGELAGESMAKGLEKKEGDIQEKISEQVDNIKIKMDELQDFNFDIEVNADNANAYIQTFKDEIIDTHNTVVDLGEELRQAGEDGGEAYEELKTTTEEYNESLRNGIDTIKEIANSTTEAMEETEEQTKETTEAVKELNQEADKGISENGGLGKMLKFLSSKEIFNFFYNNLKKIGTKLIELSGDGEKLAEKFEPVQDKLESMGGYIGKGLTPAIEGVIEDIDVMTDELINTGEAGETSASKIQKGVFIVATAFRGLIKIIRSVGIFLGSFFGGLRPVVSGFFTDLYDVAKEVIKGIGNPENWLALGNNIKYGIVQGVNGAIESVNGMLNWLRDKLGVDLGNIDTFDAGKKMEYKFDLDFSRTSDAFEAFKDTMKEGFNDIESDWSDFINDTKNGWKGLENTAMTSNKKIKDNTNKNLRGGKSSVKGAYEELEDEAVDVWNELNNLVEEHQKKYDEIPEKVKKVQDSYTKLRDSMKDVRKEAEKSLKNYNEELEKSQGEAITSLGQRYVQLKKDLIGVDDYMKKIANNLSRKELEMFQERGTTEYRGYEVKDLIELKEKLEEMKLIEENTTEEQRKSEEFTRKTSEAQEILNKLKEQEAEIEEKKAAALEKQAIATAMQNNGDGENNFRVWEDEQTKELRAWYKDREGVRQEIHNQDNIEYTKQLEDQILGLNTQLDEFRKEKNEEVEILVDTTARKKQLEEEYTKVFQEAAKKQKKELDDLITKEQRLIELRRQYLSMGGSSSHNAYGGTVLSGHTSIVGENGPEQIIARQSSYVQPRNASNSYSTVNNNQSSFSINGMEINVNNVDEFLNELKQKITYRN